MARRRSILTAIRNAVDPLRADPVPENAVIPAERSMELPSPNLDRLTSQGITSDPSQRLIENPDILRDVSSRLLESDVGRRSVLNAIRAAPMVPRIARSLQVPHVARETISPEDMVDLLMEGDSTLLSARMSLDNRLKYWLNPESAKEIGDDPTGALHQQRILNLTRSRNMADKALELGYGPDFNYLSLARNRLMSPEAYEFDPESPGIDSVFANPFKPDVEDVTDRYRSAYGSGPWYQFSFDPDLLRRIEGGIDLIPTDINKAGRYVEDVLRAPANTRFSRAELNNILYQFLKDQGAYDLMPSRDDLINRVSEAGNEASAHMGDVLSDMRDMRPRQVPDAYDAFNLFDFPEAWRYRFTNQRDD